MKAFFLLLFIPLAGFGQQTAFFETTIYFEDAIGNKDSVIVGHDEAANAEFNPQFGEVDINTPWDSVFEVRAGHYLDFSSTSGDMVLSKKIIGGTEGGLHPTYNCLWVVEPMALFVYAKHLPVTVSWKIDDFKNSFCRIGSTLTPHVIPMVWEYWFEDPEALALSACMAEDSSFTTSTFNYGSFGFYRLEDIEGVGLDTVYAFLLNFRFQGAIESPCTATIVSTEEAENFVPSNCKIYPNPSGGIINVITSDNADYGIYNSQGQLIYSGNDPQLDLSGYSGGVFFIKIRNRDGYAIKKIVRIK
jgi:type IX secretion system substrate protein